MDTDAQLDHGRRTDSPEALLLLRNFASAVLDLLRDALSKHPWEPKRRRFVEFHEDGTWQYREVVESNYWGFIMEHLRKELWELPAGVAFARWVHARGGVPGLDTMNAYKMEFEKAKEWLVLDMVLPIEDYLRRGGPLDRIDELVLSSSWRELCSLGAQPEERKSHRCFLIGGLQIDRPVDLGPFGTIEPINAQEKTRRFEHARWETRPCTIDEAASCAVQLLPALQKPIELNRAAKFVLTALRLEVGTVFGWGPIVSPTTDRIPAPCAWSPVMDFISPRTGQTIFDRAHDAALLTKKVLLDPSTASRLLQTCTELHEGAFDLFRLAFRRFNQSFQRSDIDDRIVDLAIVLEATVLADADNELFWRAQVLGEELLRSTMEPAGTARDHIRALYEARSRIVHDGIVFGEIFSGDPKWKGIAKSWKKIAATPEEFDTKMIELARGVLLAATARARSVKSPKEFRKKLEDAVVLRVPFE